MQSVSVHIGVLAVGKDAAPTQTISELAASAGHKVVGRATVNDTEAAIRAQLNRWIEDANVDVVIVSGGIESENASTALKPLITQNLPGFTDLFRYLAFQEIGASAMLSNAEAAQCGSTFVFVLPASAGAVKAAMEKLILPQLDPNTTPKNLVSSMPRVRNLSDNAIPMPIVKEKTASGAGLTPKAPAMPVRTRQVTGANVIRKIDPDKDALFDPPTKPIDVVALEAQIALSEAPTGGDAPTKQVDLSRLPKVPPGADPLPDDTDQIAPGDLPPRSTRLESQPIEQPLPARKDRKNLRTEPSAVVPMPPRTPAIPAKSGLIPEPPAPRGPVKMPESGHAPVAPLPALAPLAKKPPTEPPPSPPARPKQTTGQAPVAVPSVIPKQPSGPTRKAPSQPPPIARAPKSPSEPPPPPRPARSPSSPPPSPPPRPQTGPTATVKPELPAVAAPVSLPEPAKRPPTSPPPPPAQPDMAALVATPLRRTTGELPAGTFNYPVVHSGPSKLVLILAGIALLAAGFVVVVFVVPMLTANKTTTPAPTPTAKPEEVVATAPIDAVAAVEPDPQPDIEEPVATGSAKPTPTPTNQTQTPTGTRPPRGGTPPKPGRGSAAAVPEGSGAGSQEDTIENAPNNPAPDPSDCDEVSCVLAKYDRPCCEKYRPKESDIKPRTAGGLPAELDKSMVRAGIEKVKPRVVACGEKSSERGTVKVSVSVRPDGSVSTTNIVSTPNPELGECVVTVMKKAEFGKSVGGGSFTYPFVF